MKSPTQLQVEQRKQVIAKEFPPPPISQELVEWLEGTYFAQPFKSSDPAHVDFQLRLAGQLALVQQLRDIHTEQSLDNAEDQRIAEGIATPDAGVQF